MLASSATYHPPPGSLARQPLLERSLIFLPALALAIVALPYRYELTLSEPDLVRMAAAMIYGAATGAHETAGMHYGLSFSFGYYKILYAIAPPAWLRDPDLVALLINHAGTVSGLLCALATTAYLAKLLGRVPGVAAATIFFLSPMMLPVALSGHPLIGATGCLFAAGLLLARGGDLPPGARRWAHSACAFALVVLGLSLRAEILLALPFLWLALLAEPGRSGWRWRTLVRRALLLGGAFAAFLALQHGYVAAEGGAGTRLAHFLGTYISISRMARGMVVLALAAGVVTLLAAALAAWRLRRDKILYLLVVLAGPALVFWLPNPQPARHFFFAALALSIVVALWLHRSLKSAATVLALGLAIALANQLVAEVLYAPIASRYSWSYPATGRQPTQQVPLGAFPLAQRANQRQAALERDEALRLVRHAPRRLLILADSQHSMIAQLIAADPGLKWTDQFLDGILVTKLESPAHSIVLVEKYSAWPRDVTGEVLANPVWQSWPVYVQPFTVSRYDKTTVPAERRFELP